MGMQTGSLNGADETKAFILKTLAEKMMEIDLHGCAVGKVQDQRLAALERCAISAEASIKEIIRTLDTKMNWIIMLGIILALMGGINVWQEILKLFIK